MSPQFDGPIYRSSDLWVLDECLIVLVWQGPRDAVEVPGDLLWQLAIGNFNLIDLRRECPRTPCPGECLKRGCQSVCEQGSDL
jgi:hypothetical protein